MDTTALIVVLIIVVIVVVVVMWWALSGDKEKKVKQTLEFLPPKSGYISGYNDYATEIITDGSIPESDIQIRKIGFKDLNNNRYTLWEDDISTPAELSYSDDFQQTDGAFYLDIYIKSIHCDKQGVICDDSNIDGEYKRIKPHSLTPKDFELTSEESQTTIYTGRFNLNVSQTDTNTPVYINLVFKVDSVTESTENDSDDETDSYIEDDIIEDQTVTETSTMEMAPPVVTESYTGREYYTTDDFVSNVESSTLTNSDVFLEQVFIIPKDTTDGTHIVFYGKDDETNNYKVMKNVNYTWNDEDSFGIDISLKKSKCEDNQSFTCEPQYEITKPDGTIFWGITQSQEMTLKEMGDPIEIDYDGTEIYKFSLFLDNAKQHKFNLKFKYNVPDKVQMLSNLVPEIGSSYSGSNIVAMSYVLSDNITSEPLFDGTATSNVEVTKDYIDGSINVEFESENQDDVTLDFKDMSKTLEGDKKIYEIDDNDIKYKFVVKKDDPVESTTTPADGA